MSEKKRWCDECGGAVGAPCHRRSETMLEVPRTDWAATNRCLDNALIAMRAALKDWPGGDMRFKRDSDTPGIATVRAYVASYDGEPRTFGLEYDGRSNDNCCAATADMIGRNSMRGTPNYLAVLVEGPGADQWTVMTLETAIEGGFVYTWEV